MSTGSATSSTTTPRLTRDSYVHRVGRTARAGRDGVAITFVSAENEVAMSQIVGELNLVDEYQRDGFLVRPPQRSAPKRRPRGGSPAGGRRRAAPARG